MTPDEQLDKWVMGESVHNSERDECCPDFSCCNPELLADESTRRTFRDRPELRDKMLMMFLGAAFAGEPIHIIGSIEGEA